MSQMRLAGGRQFSPIAVAILSLAPGHQLSMPGVSHRQIHNISKTLRKYGAPIRCRSTNKGVKVTRLEPSDQPHHMLGASRRGSRWVAQIRANDRVKYLGSFATQDAAHTAYLRAKNQIEREGSEK